MKLKRTTPQEMCSIVHRYWTARPGPLSGTEATSQRFFAVPRYVTLVRADAAAINNFFSYMSVGEPWRTKALRLLLLVACRSDLAFWLASKRGLIATTVDTADYPGVRWSAVDALVAEWQFVACFSLAEDVVAHCLSSPEYERCLLSEVEARRAVVGTVPVPELKDVHLEHPAGYTERIIRGSGGVEERDRYFEQVQTQLVQSYLQSKEDVNLHAYLARLQALVLERYAANEAIADRMARLIAMVTKLTTPEDSLVLARCHGDLNSHQILVEDETPYLIDWSESEICSISYDFAYSAVFHFGWRDFGSSLWVPELDRLRAGIRAMTHPYHPAVLIGLMLIELGVKQYSDYNERRGSMRSWRRMTDLYLGAPYTKDGARPFAGGVLNQP